MFSYNAEIVEIQKQTDEIKTFKIKLKNGQPLTYKAGQFTTIGVLLKDNEKYDYEKGAFIEDNELQKKERGNWLIRAYSITSAPQVDGEEIHFYIVNVEKGALTTKLFELEVGDDIYLGERAIGHMNMEDVEEDANIVLLGTGTGLAPLRSLVRGWKDTMFNGKRKVALFMGVRHEHEIGYRAELEGFEKECKDFNFFPVLSRATESWNGTSGYVQEIMTDKLKEAWGVDEPFIPNKTYIFICGNPKMCDQAMELLESKGLKRNTIKEKGEIRCDKH